ncbi:alpha/beta-hydrolase [Viridothelium virens]|uniref:Alpha/beta-hydrolase n=1 Tax=Viridothelium virens TaxID=1048519 RepID=A0A6A6HMW8_VIRVR|nr:alpha/beta-hydrolase [Viridothelium virens]
MASLANVVGVARSTVGAYLAAFGRALVSPLRPADSPSFYKDVTFAKFRTFHTLSNSSQEQWLFPSTDATYLQVAQERGFNPDSIDLPYDSRAHWIGPRSSDKIFIFFHGGGYGLPCSAGHLHWLVDLTHSLQSQGHSISTVLLSYSLAPGAPYPTQLEQACALLRHLLEIEHRAPSDLLVGGDSAGGNLTLALLSHLLHPHPDVEPLALSEPLAAALLISPWVSFSLDWRSVDANVLKDVIAVPLLVRMAAQFMGGAPPDAYNQAVLAPKGWFEGSEGVVRRVWVYGGRWELLMDSIEKVAGLLAEGHGDVRVVVQEDGVHEDMITDRQLGYTHKAKGTVWVEDFIKEVC